jgi:hypothetical protein
MTLSSLSIYVVFVDPLQGNSVATPFLFLQLRLIVELIGIEMAWKSILATHML